MFGVYIAIMYYLALFKKIKNIPLKKNVAKQDKDP